MSWIGAPEKWVSRISVGGSRRGDLAGVSVLGRRKRAIEGHSGTGCAYPVLMAKCEVCGNEYDKAFEIVKDGERHTFDSFECAIHALAPTCASCGVAIIGHGVEAGGCIYCGAHCAQADGVAVARDRA